MTLHLIDGCGYIYRAFYAIQKLKTSRGLPTNALFGFATMLRKFQAEKARELAAVVFDVGRETFRTQISKDYKANRPPVPEELLVQLPYARRIASALGLAVIEVQGVEADDVIATLTTMARARGLDVVIESADKDLFQLVGDGVVVHDSMRGKTYDTAGVAEKFGVHPAQIRDLLALLGDTSDNIPGVPGIGEKGASELLRKYGSLEGIYEHLDDLPPRRREALLAGRDSAFLSRELATLKCDVPLDVDLFALRPGTGDLDEQKALWKELEFRSFLEELPEAPRSGPACTQVLEVMRDVSGDDATAAIAGSLAPSVAAVFGRRDPVSPDCLGLAVAVSPDRAFFLRPAAVPEGLLLDLARAISQRPWRGAGYKELYQVFAQAGAELGPPVLDPVIGNYVLHPERETHTLDSLAMELFQLTLPADPSPRAVAERAVAVMRLSDEVAAQLEDAGLGPVVRDVELPLARVLSEMEITGVMVDRGALEALSTSLLEELRGIERRIIEAAGVVFNPNSPKQLADVLFGKLCLPVVRKTKTGPSTDVSVLEELSDRHPVPGLILEYRALAKLKSTYADALGALINPKTGRVHTSYNQTVTATGRLSSSDPNLQNIPIRTEAGRKVRRAFVAAPGHVFVAADYSQIELRVLAHLSGDEQLIAAFMHNMDIHAQTAARIFKTTSVTPEQRRAAKVVNFGVLYGMGAYRLSRDLHVDMAEAQSIIDEYFRAFPQVKRYLDETIETARREGAVRMLSGRQRAIEGIHSANRNERAAAERMALNAPIQGTAADIIKVAMVRLRERVRGLPIRLVLQVHDELVLEVHEGYEKVAADILREVMEGAMELRVPLKVDVAVGRSWADL